MHAIKTLRLQAAPPRFLRPAARCPTLDLSLHTEAEERLPDFILEVYTENTGLFIGERTLMPPQCKVHACSCLKSAWIML